MTTDGGGYLAPQVKRGDQRTVLVTQKFERLDPEPLTRASLLLFACADEVGRGNRRVLAALIAAGADHITGPGARLSPGGNSASGREFRVIWVRHDNEHTLRLAVWLLLH
jgi:hypothetical protein